MRVYSPLNMVYSFRALFLFLLASVINICWAEPLSISLHRMRSPLKHLMINRHEPKYQQLISHLESIKGTSNTVPLFKFLDYEFYGKVLVGHPGQTFKVVFDTSWSDLWIPSILCPYLNPACAPRNKYDSTRSSTYVDVKKKYVRNLGNYNLTGKIACDLVHIGQMNITNQTFGAVDSIPWKEFFFSKADGIFGLSFDTFVTDGITPFIYSLVKQKLIEKQIFSLYMNRDLSSKKGGALLLGDIDKKHFRGNLSYVRVDPRTGFWEIPVDKITVNKHGTIPAQSFCEGGCTSIIDSSTNEIRGPPDDIDTINGLMGARRFLFGRSIVDCGIINTLPHLVIVIGGKNYELKGPDFVQKMNYGPVTVCLSSFSHYDADGPAKWTFGGAFLAKYYTVFDMDQFQIGFAPANL